MFRAFVGMPPRPGCRSGGSGLAFNGRMASGSQADNRLNTVSKVLCRWQFRPSRRYLHPAWLPSMAAIYIRFKITVRRVNPHEDSSVIKAADKSDAATQKSRKFLLGVLIPGAQLVGELVAMATDSGEYRSKTIDAMRGYPFDARLYHRKMSCQESSAQLRPLQLKSLNRSGWQQTCGILRRYQIWQMTATCRESAWRGKSWGCY